MEKRHEMRRKLVILSSVIAILATISYGSLAYFTSVSKAENVVTTGQIKLEVQQEPQAEDGDIIMPGDTVDRTATVKNVGANPLFLRVQLNAGILENEALKADGCMSMAINTKDWTERDGFYYYNEVLAPGETTAPIFTAIYFDGPGMGNEYIGKTLILDVDAYGVQSENNGADPLSAMGWPEVKGAQ